MGARASRPLWEARETANVAGGTPALPENTETGMRPVSDVSVEGNGTPSERPFFFLQVGV
jgi:hypothetical protein